MNEHVDLENLAHKEFCNDAVFETIEEMKNLASKCKDVKKFIHVLMCCYFENLLNYNLWNNRLSEDREHNFYSLDETLRLSGSHFDIDFVLNELNIKNILEEV